MYKLTDGASIIRLSDGAFIPHDPQNADYDAYLAWVSIGNKPLPADPVAPVIPPQVTRFQARAALYKAGLLERVEAMMADPKTDRLTALAWQDAQTFKRQSGMVLDMAAKLDLTERQLDELFAAAAAIE